MLQLNTGKFYGRIGRTNELKGILYTNLRLARSGPLVTKAGALTSLDGSGQNTFLYELTEQLEYREGREFLISHTLNAYAPDFAVIASFGLNGLCAVESDTIIRLTEGGPRIGVQNPVRELVPRVFEKNIFCQPQDENFFAEFVEQLMALEQQHYAAAMSAMSTYMAALARLADDCSLAYTLLVASLESLAQKFDGHRAKWEDYDQTKRLAIDKALTGADDAVIQKVRNAVVANEHVALARRFKDFTLAHVEDSYFRPDLALVKNPIGKSRLETALKQAYVLRSKHVHTLQEIPVDLKQPYRMDYQLVDGLPVLTFEGLTRLARHVILNFVKRGPKVTTELLSPTFRRYGTMYMEMEAKYWLGNTANLHPSQGRRRLGGFLEQCSTYLLEPATAQFTNLDELLAEVEKLLEKKMLVELRRPFVALYVLFSSLRKETWEAQKAIDFVKKYERLLGPPSTEAWITNLLMDITPNWGLADYVTVFDGYVRSRNTENGLKLPELFEVAMGLHLAELHRLAGDSHAVRKAISEAVDQFPGSAGLRRFENSYIDGDAVDWKGIMLPPALSQQAP